MAKRDPYTKTKIMTVSSRSLFGRKTEMEKQIEKWEGLGWIVTHNRPIKGNKNKHELTFEYRMSDDEIEAQKKNVKRVRIGCVALIAVIFAISYINGAIKDAQNEAIVAPTRTALAQLAITMVAQAQATKQQQSIDGTATATLWTPTFTPTATYTPTITYTPSSTFTPTITYTPSNTYTPTITFTPTNTATITNTPQPTNTPPPPTATSAPRQSYYTINNANVRACPRTACDIVTKVQSGIIINTYGTEQGDKVSGSNVWHKVSINGAEGYIHSSLLSRTAPAPNPAPVQIQPKPISTIPNAFSPVPPAAPVGASCPNISFTCSKLTCAQAYACLAAGHSDLDRDHDGVPCETVCSGG